MLRQNEYVVVLYNNVMSCGSKEDKDYGNRSTFLHTNTHSHGFDALTLADAEIIIFD